LKALRQGINLKITKAGFLYTLLSIFIGVSAVNTGNNLLYVIVSFLLSLMWLSGVFARINLSGLRVEISLPREAYAKRRALIGVRVFKTSKIPSFLLTLRLEVSSKKGERYLLSKKISHLKGEKELILEFLPRERGEYEITLLEISSLYPVSFFKRFLRIPYQGSFLVFPEPLKCLFEDEDLKRRGDSASSRKEGISEFFGLSEFVPGTPRKFISWKAFAKWETLKRKLFLEEESPVLILEVLSLPGRDLEEKLSCATFLVLTSLERGRAVGIKLGKVVIPPGTGEAQKLRILKELARYEART